MKRTLAILVIMFFSLSSIIYLQKYAESEFINIVEGKGNIVTIKSTLEPEKTISILNEASDNFKVSFTKKEYIIPSKSNENGTFKLYVSRYSNGLLDKIKYKEIKGNLNRNMFISTQKTSSNEQIGIINMLYRASEIEIKSLDSATLLSLNTEYYLSTDDSAITNEIITFLNKAGISATEYTGARASVSKDTKVLWLLISIFILIIITCLYKFIMDFKEIAIKKLSGYDEKSIKREFLIDFVKTNAIITLLFLLVVVILSFMTYKTFNIDLLAKYILVLACFTIFLSFIFYLLTSFVHYVNIAQMLKNKKPLKELQFMHFISIFFFSLIIINVGVNSVLVITELLGQNSNISFWESSRAYAFTTISNVEESEDGNMYEIGVKAQKFYSMMEKEGALVFSPSDYFYTSKQEREHIAEQYGAPSYLNEYVGINENYLKKYPIKDIHDKNVVIENKKNVMTILVPEKYMNVKEDLEKAYTEQYKELRFFDENLYRDSQQLQLISTPVTTEFIYIKNGQKHFSYNPDVERENGNFVEDPILLLYTDDNQGTDIYLSFLSRGGLYLRVKNIEDPFSEIAPFIDQSGLHANITSTPALYSKFSERIHILYKTVAENITALVLSIIIVLLIGVFMSMNYLEKYKMENSVKTLTGYSFWNRHRVYLLENIVTILISGILTGILLSNMQVALYITILLLVLHTFVLSIVLKHKDFASIRDTLKGC